MKPAPFDYYAPASVEEALSHLAEHGYDAKALAGGQSLVPMMNFRLVQPSVLVDLNGIPDLSYIRPADGGGILLGAMTRHRQVEFDPLVAQTMPLLHECVPHIGYPQIRNRGTLGGSLSHADAAAELVTVTVALDGRFKVRSQDGERWVPAEEFFVGLFATALDPHELLVEVELPPMAEHSGWSLMEVARRSHDFALVGVAVVVALDEGGKCVRAKMVFLSAGDGPVVAERSADLLKGQVPDQEAFRAAAELAAYEEIDPGNDIHASANFRRRLASVLARRALSEAFQRAKASR